MDEADRPPAVLALLVTPGSWAEGVTEMRVVAAGMGKTGGQRHGHRHTGKVWGTLS
jgi:hypothetical protein